MTKFWFILIATPDQFRIVDFGMGIFVENELHPQKIF